LGATFKTEVSLEAYEIGTERLTPEVVWADAEKAKVAPSCTEVLAAGVRLTLPGKSGGPALVPLPQALKLHKKRMAAANHKAFKHDLSMHPDLPMHPL
jgi:hypothetical protein